MKNDIHHYFFSFFLSTSLSTAADVEASISYLQHISVT